MEKTVTVKYTEATLVELDPEGRLQEVLFQIKKIVIVYVLTLLQAGKMSSKLRQRSWLLYYLITNADTSNIKVNLVWEIVGLNTREQYLYRFYVIKKTNSIEDWFVLIC